MTGKEAGKRLAVELVDAKLNKLCTWTEYLAAFPMLQLSTNQWAGNKGDITEEQYTNVLNVISKNWVKKGVLIN